MMIPSQNPKIAMRALLILCFFVTSFSLSAQPLKIGDQAPPLHIIKWLKGKPVNDFQKGKVYLVEFGYVGCPPCRKAIPHLSELSQKYRKDGKVEVISIFTAESDPEKPSDLSYIKRIRDLVNFMGDRMDYTIAVDVPVQKTRQLWANSSGFPKFFIVDQRGKIAFNGGGFAEIDYAINAVVNTGKYDRNDYLNDSRQRERDAENASWASFKDREHFFASKKDYATLLKSIDTALTNTSIGHREELLFAKFRTFLFLNDSVAADQCLEELMVNKKGNWEYLNEKFQELVPPADARPLFNYERYIEIAKHVVEEVGTPFLKSVHLGLQAHIMYACKRNKEEALAVLNQALTLVKNSGVKKDIERVEEDIERFKNKVARIEQADADWRDLLVIQNKSAMDDIEKARKENDNVATHQLLFKYKPKQAELAQQFWKKYPSDSRRHQALDFYLNLNLASVPWIGYISDTLHAKLNDVEKQLSYDSRKHRERNLGYGHAYFRMFPLDLKAEAEWVKNGNEMANEVLQNPFTDLETKEALEWTLFGRDWRTAVYRFNHLPKNDERLDDNITLMEGDFWKGVAITYWEPFWVRFNTHILKYSELPSLTDRAVDFLSGTATFVPELVTSYWQQIIERYGDVKNQLSANKNIQAMVKRAEDQLRALQIQQRQIPVDMKFTDIGGREIDLAKYRGKVVLIDFWASWCAPCVAGLPKLKAQYEKYHDKGFEIIGICFDDETKRDAVKKLIADSALIGPQRFEGVGFNNDKYKQLFGIYGLPTVWLLDKNGMLISTTARGDELDRLLNEYL